MGAVSLLRWSKERGRKQSEKRECEAESGEKRVPEKRIHSDGLRPAAPDARSIVLPLTKARAFPCNTETDKLTCLFFIIFAL